MNLLTDFTNIPLQFPTNAPMRVICAWCKRVKVDGKFIEIKDFAPGLNDTHGICQDCYEKVKNK